MSSHIKLKYTLFSIPFFNNIEQQRRKKGINIQLGIKRQKAIKTKTDRSEELLFGLYML
jgi:hypothetical protein